MNVKPQDKMTIRLLNSYQGVDPPLFIKVMNKAKASLIRKTPIYQYMALYMCVSADVS
jgi:hypothetical protein